MWVRREWRILLRALGLLGFLVFLAFSHAFIAKDSLVVGESRLKGGVGSELFPKGSAFASDALHTRFFPYADRMGGHATYPASLDPFFSSFVYSPFALPNPASKVYP